MSAYEDVKKLTLDPGVHHLAQLLDSLQEQVYECCGAPVAKKVETDAKESPHPSGAKKGAKK